MIKVYHKTQSLAHRASWPDGYHLVATVPGDDKDQAFEFTNHIDESWMKNVDVQAEVGDHRSTSVGDVMQDDAGNLWSVATFGFEPLSAVTPAMAGVTKNDGRPQCRAMTRIKRRESDTMWSFFRYNYYGGQIWTHPAGWRAIQTINRYYTPTGFSVHDETGQYVGHVRSASELP